MIGAAYFGIVAARVALNAISGSGFWLDAYRMTVKSGEEDGYNGYTVRWRIPASALRATGSLARVRFMPGASGMALAKAYIGIAKAGDASEVDFDATPTQLKFDGGAAGKTSSIEFVSDPLAFTVDGTAPILVSAYFSGTTALCKLQGLPSAGSSTYYKSSVDQAATVDVSGYSSSTVNAVGLLAVEVDDVANVADTDPVNYTAIGPSKFGVSWGNYTIRVVCAASRLADVVSATAQVRLSGNFFGSNGGTITKCYIGAAKAASDAYDFDGAPTQVLFGGAAGATVAAQADLWSDPVSIALDGTKPVMVSFYCASGSLAQTQISQFAEDWTCFYKAGDSAATQDTSGYTSGYAYIPLVTAIALYA